MNRVKCRLTNGEHEILFEGEAEVEALKEDGKLIRMRSGEEQMIWKILKKGVVIENHSEIVTILYLFGHGSGKAHMLTPYGEMTARLEHVIILKNSQNLSVSYRIEQGESFSFDLSFDRGDSDKEPIEENEE